METKCIDKKILHIARTKINKDVIVLYMLSKKYKLDLLSLLILYEIYDKDVFVFFYILSNNDSPLLGKTVDDINFGDSIRELPKETNLKLMFTKAKKISDALRRGSEFGLTSVTLPWYNLLKQYCMKSPNSGESYINFYNLLEPETEKETKRKIKSKAKKEKALI